MHYFVNGSIKKIGETQKFGDKFQKREFVIETDEQYPETLKLEFINENVDVLDTYIVGEMVTVAFVLKGSEYQGKHYINARAIAIDSIDEARLQKEFEKQKRDNKRVQALLDSVKVKK